MVLFTTYGQRHVLGAVRADLSDLLHDAATAALDAPPGRYQRFVPLDAQDFPIPPGRSARYTVVEAVLVEGRSVAAKEEFYRRLYDGAAALGITAADLEVVLLEVPAHDVAVRGRSIAAHRALARA